MLKAETILCCTPLCHRPCCSTRTTMPLNNSVNLIMPEFFIGIEQFPHLHSTPLLKMSHQHIISRPLFKSHAVTDDDIAVVRIFLFFLACNCPRVSAVVAYLKPGSTRQTVSWTVPKPSCGGTLNSVKPAISPGHSFPIGQHTVTYVYKTSAGFDMKCSVNISVKGN